MPQANPQPFRNGNPSAPLTWALADQRQGTANQCLGVADALGSPYEIKEIPHSSLAYLPNFILQSSLAGLQADHRDNIRPPWPDLVISGGRRTAPIARYIKRQSERPGGKRCFLAHIMHPGPAAGAGAFDLIAVPRHDRPHARLGEAANLYPVTGAPHRVTGDALAAAGGQWQDAFEKYSRPLVGLLLGGGTRRKTFGKAEARELGASAGRLTKAAGGSLIVTTSPRTGDIAGQVAAAAASAGAAPELVHRWSPDGENPYLGILALADLLVVTGDSVSMCTEACATGKPVYIYAPPGFSVAKHSRFQADLFAKGFARPLADRFDTWEHPPHNPSLEIAGEIRRRMEQRSRD